MARKEEERVFIIECIQLYRKLPSLWKVKSKEYHDRKKKNAAYETLLSKYKEMFPQASKDDVKKRFNSLRTNYRKELKKHNDSMKSGSSADDIYQPTLWYYDEMFFLEDQESIADSQSSMDTQSTIGNPGEESERSSVDNNYSQEGTSTVGTDEAPSTSFAVPKTKNKNLKKKYEDDLLQLAANRLTEKPDEYQNWALSCAAEIKKMEPMQQIFAKKAIADIIMEGQLGLLHRYSNEDANTTEYEAEDTRSSIEFETEEPAILKFEDTQLDYLMQTSSKPKKRRLNDPLQLNDVRPIVNSNQEYIEEQVLQDNVNISDDECTTFGTLVALKLRKLSDDRRDVMMVKINQLFVDERRNNAENQQNLLD